MEQWQSLLERFLRNECTARENRMVYHALRDGLIDDELRCAIDTVMNDGDTLTYIERMEPVPDDMLMNIRSMLKKQKTKPAAAKRRTVITEWLKIAAAVAITLSVSWMVFHAAPAKEEPLQAKMNTVRVPAGQTVNLTLADGTNIWLNARTTLQYPGVFSGNSREVILSGEGFFDVAHDNEKPFVVHAGEYNITALGTQFNVDAYPGSAGFTASLLEGSIRVSSASDSSQNIILQPNTMARLREGKLVAEVIADLNYFRWRDGLISFKDTPFNILMEKFEKCYGITIVVENRSVKNYAPTGKFRQSDGIDYALRVLQRDFKFRFERDDENHIIYIR
jgi:ferric-dicitrate binding protein FerR (iron transport regulator)